jgi:hypothetical protein
MLCITIPLGNLGFQLSVLNIVYYYLEPIQWIGVCSLGLFIGHGREPPSHLQAPATPVETNQIGHQRLCILSLYYCTLNDPTTSELQA